MLSGLFLKLLHPHMDLIDPLDRVILALGHGSSDDLASTESAPARRIHSVVSWNPNIIGMAVGTVLF